jgi:hypothetical protein
MWASYIVNSLKYNVKLGFCPVLTLKNHTWGVGELRVEGGKEVESIGKKQRTLLFLSTFDF